MTLKNLLKFFSILLCATILFAVLASHAQAQITTPTGMPTLSDIQKASGQADGSDADLSRMILKRLFGDFGDTPFTATGAADTLLGALFFTFNAALFVVGSAYIGYQVLMAVATSAHEGEVLGKRLNGLWVPIRFGVGVFGMLPVFKGFSLAQSMVLGTALLGIGMANLMVDKAIDSVSNFNAVIPPPGMLNTGSLALSVNSDIAHQLFAMNVCVLAVKDYGDQLDSAAPATYQNAPMMVVNETGVTTVSRGIDCGKVTMKFEENQLRKQGSGLGRIAQNLFGVGGFRSPAVDYDAINKRGEQVAQLRLNTLHSLQHDMESVASTWYTNMLNGDPSGLVYPSAEIFAALEANLDKEYQGFEAIKTIADGETGAITQVARENMRAGGWMGIGSWHATYAEQDAAIQSAFTASYMETDPPNLATSSLPPSVQNALLRVFVGREESEKNGNGYCDWEIASPLLPSTPRNAIGECAPAQNMVMALLGSVNAGGTGMVNPITTSKNLGDFMLTTVGAVITVKLAAEAAELLPIGKATKMASKVAEKFSSNKLMSKASNMIKGFMGGFGSTVLFAFFLLGIVFAVYIPMIPFITWFTACVSYLASVIEGLVAGQVWAFQHLSSEGEGMGQRTEKGYIYLLNMLLRPGLMVLGFFFASALMTLAATFMFDQLGTAFANIQGDTNTGPFIMLGMLFIYMILMLTSVQTITNLIYEIPDRVIAWFGHAAEARLAKDMDRMTEGKMEQSARWAQTAVLGKSLGR